MAKYRILVGMNYTPDGEEKEVRAEVGEIREDIPERSVKWLQRDGHIEEARERSATAKAARSREVRKAAKEAEQPADIPSKLEEIGKEKE